jgi:hypothetical protein
MKTKHKAIIMEKKFWYSIVLTEDYNFVKVPTMMFPFKKVGAEVEIETTPHYAVKNILKSVH